MILFHKGVAGTCLPSMFPVVYARRTAAPVCLLNGGLLDRFVAGVPFIRDLDQVVIRISKIKR